jgi:hypothetical protein
MTSGNDRVMTWATGPMEPLPLAMEALTEAYGSAIPQGAIDLLKNPNKPGRVVAIFFCGRSGSFFLQSFFDLRTNPRVLTVQPAALAHFEDIIQQRDIDRVVQGGIQFDADPSTGASLFEWLEWILRSFSGIFTKMPGQPGLDHLLAPVSAFSKLVYAQMRWLGPDNLTYESLLKILFVASALARGEKFDCGQPLVYLWQAHLPIAERKRGILKTFEGSRLLTIVRFPEKTLDSHLVHHGFESVSPPLSSLFRRLCIDHLAESADMVGDEASGREKAVRFEDLHHHTAFVLKAICDWLDVPAHDLGENQFTLTVRGKSVTGARRLTSGEFESKLLSHFDRIKVRHLLRENYRTWRYEGLLAGGLQPSLDECARDELCRRLTFGAHALLCQHSGENATVIAEETRLLAAAIAAERQRRDDGIRLTPLLYDVNELPQSNGFKPVL